jgi:hypothetical protein
LSGWGSRAASEHSRSTQNFSKLLIMDCMNLNICYLSVKSLATQKVDKLLIMVCIYLINLNYLKMKTAVKIKWIMGAAGIITLRYRLGGSVASPLPPPP